MSKVTIHYNTAEDLREQIMIIAAQVGPPPEPGEEASLALFSNEELLNEIARRDMPTMTLTATPTPEPEGNGAEPPKQRGRKPKAQATVATQPTATAASGNGAANEPAAAAPALPQVPAGDPAAVVQTLPTEDEMLALMSELYSATGDMSLVRGLMQEVGGKTQLTQLPPGVWPQLKTRLQSELANAKAKAAS